MCGYNCVAMKNLLTWVEVSRDALSHNIKEFKKRVGSNVILCPCVKANAYGHGLVEVSKVFLDSGADWLAVNALYEAEVLRCKAGITAPIYIMGYTMMEDLARVWELGVRQVVYDRETVEKLGEVAGQFDKPIKLHIKVETGNNRQGIRIEDLVDFAKHILSVGGAGTGASGEAGPCGSGKLEIEGIATHFANIEDTTDHTYAFEQLEKFKKAQEMLKEAGIEVPMMHCANSAATILYPETYLNMVRVGISAYGMWPSPETRVSYQNLHKNGFELQPAFTWKSIVAQVKNVTKGDFIGYGCTCRATRDTKMAIIPIGYYDGYDRRLSSNAHVLIRGQRAKVLGRVCMNIVMVDASDIPDVVVEDEVVLMGAQEFDGVRDVISAEQFAEWVGTINYEVTTRVNERIPRIVTT